MMASRSLQGGAETRRKELLLAPGLGGWGQGSKHFGNHPKVALSDVPSRVGSFRTSAYEIKGLRPPQVFAFGARNAIKGLLAAAGSAYEEALGHGSAGPRRPAQEATGNVCAVWS
jgi:hypothetical protein